MKKAIFFTTFVLLLVPTLAFGATLRGGTHYTLPADETVEGNLYIGAGGATINGVVTGDLVAAGGTITVTGTVQGDVLVAGGTLSLGGKLGDDVRIAGGNIDISTEVPGDLTVAGGDVGIFPAGAVRGDVLAAGGNVKIAGPVNGIISGAAGTLTLASTVGGNVDVRVGNLVLESGASLAGDLKYEAKQEATIASGATIAGKTEFREARWNHFGFALGGAAIIGWFISVIAMLVAAVVLVLIFPRFSEALVARTMKAFWRHALYGLLFLIVTPIVSTLLFVTVIGWMLGLALLVIYGLFVMFASAYGNILLGTYLMRIARKKEQLPLHWTTAVIGVLIASFIGLVPVIGWIFIFIFFVAGLGGFFVHDWEKMRGQ